MATAASTAYARNIGALLTYLLHDRGPKDGSPKDGSPKDGGPEDSGPNDGNPTVDLADEIQAAVVVTHSGSVVHPAVVALLDGRARLGGSR